MIILKVTYLDFSFATDDFRDWPGLCTQLHRDARKESLNPGKRIWHFLPRKTRRLIANLTDDTELSLENKSAIAGALNELLEKPNFYKKQFFAKTDLPAAAQKLLSRESQPLTIKKVQNLNRLLIEAAYPREISKKQQKQKTGDSPKKPAASSKADSPMLQVGKRMSYNIYSNMGEPLVRQGELFTPEHQKKIRTWRDPELVGLDKKEKEAVDQYFALGKISEDDIHERRKTLKSETAHADDTILRGVYLCDRALLYVNEDSLTLSTSDIDILFSLEPEKIHLASYSSDEGRNLIEPYENDILKAITYFSVQEGQATRLLHPDAQPLVDLEEIAQHAPLPRPAFIPRPRTQREMEEMIGFCDQAASDLATTLNTPGRTRTKLGTSMVEKHSGLVKESISQVIKDPDLAANFLPHLNSSDFLADHAVKTKILSIELATNMGLSKREIMDLGLSAIVQDIGMNSIPRVEQILNKKTPLTSNEIDQISQHPSIGRDIIQNSERIPEQVRNIVLHSHERIDGSGYPNGLKGEQIDKLAKVLSVSSVYTALISPRPYRQAVSPYYAMVTLVRYMYHRLLDREIVSKLIETLSLYPIGTLVKLESGEIAKVVSANEKNYLKPYVRILIDSGGRELDPLPPAIDLSEENREIVSTVDPEKYPKLADPEIF
jgi:HD-GYP domain-containing protein (c-di-GMP phosphodiesterase class II)